MAADEDRLKAVVEHLVQNAVEAVGRAGRVQVRLAGEGRMAVVEIEDDGPGMEPDFVREKLFRPFATTKEAGYGIGVYESRDFAQALGGGLDVTSEPGTGTIMRMRLARGRAAVTRQRFRRKNPKWPNEKPKLLIVEDDAGLAAPARLDLRRLRGPLGRRSGGGRSRW